MTQREGLNEDFIAMYVLAAYFLMCDRMSSCVLLLLLYFTSLILDPFSVFIKEGKSEVKEGQESKNNNHIPKSNETNQVRKQTRKEKKHCARKRRLRNAIGSQTFRDHMKHHLTYTAYTREGNDGHRRHVFLSRKDDRWKRDIKATRQPETFWEGLSLEQNICEKHSWLSCIDSKTLCKTLSSSSCRGSITLFMQWFVRQSLGPWLFLCRIHMNPFYADFSWCHDQYHDSHLIRLARGMRETRNTGNGISVASFLYSKTHCHSITEIDEVSLLFSSNTWRGAWDLKSSLSCSATKKKRESCLSNRKEVQLYLTMQMYDRDDDVDDDHHHWEDVRDDGKSCQNYKSTKYGCRILIERDDSLWKWIISFA